MQAIARSSQLCLLTNRLNAARAAGAVVVAAPGAAAYSVRIKTWLTGRNKGNPCNNNDEQ